MNQDPKPTDPVTEFHIRPNASYKRASLPWLLGGLVVIGLGIGLRMAWLGFWLILPFSLVELGLVFYLFYRVQRSASYIERIRIQGEHVEIDHIEPGQDQNWQLPLHWARVDLRKPAHHWYPHRLLLGSSGQWIEIGKCLTDDERKGLADAIQSEIQRARAISYA